MKRSRVGIALSGGGIRGFGHLGVLQYLDEIGVKPSAISGTSAGALAAAFYAAGFSPQEILEIGKKEKFFKLTDLAVLKGGLFNPNIFAKIIKKYIPHDSIEKLNIPINIVTTDITHSQSCILKEGSLSFAVKSSCCFPLFFQPVKNGDKYLVDGGVLNNFPADVIKEKCDKVIGVYVSPNNQDQIKLGYTNIVERVISLSFQSQLERQKKFCDVFIEPEGIGKYGTFSFGKIDEIFELGYNSAKSQKKDLIKLVYN